LVSSIQNYPISIFEKRKNIRAFSFGLGAAAKPGKYALAGKEEAASRDAGTRRIECDANKRGFRT